MSVFAAYLHDGHTVAHSFMRSVMHTPREQLYGQQFHGRLTRTGGIPDGRNDVTRHWLDDTDAEWLWFVDSDMGWPADALDNLLLQAHSIERPIVGAHCVALHHGEPDGSGGYRTWPVSTAYRWDDVGFTTLDLAGEYRPLVPVDATGAACLLIHRGVAERMREEAGWCDVWWNPLPAVGGRLYGEDLSFFRRVLQLPEPTPVHILMDVRTTHQKQVWLT